MTVPLDAGDRKILLISVCLLALLTVVAVLVPSENGEPSQGFPSSYSTARDGAKAAYSLLEEMGYRVEHWTQPPGDLPASSTHTVLIVAGPLVPASSEEAIQLRQFVSRGGRLLITGLSGAEMIGAEGVEPASDFYEQWETFPAEQPAPLTRHAPEIAMESSVRWEYLLSGQQRYYGSNDGATVTEFHIGKGEVIWWAGDSPLTNAGITRASNLALFLNSIGLPEDTRVLWDEYFHGVRSGLWHYVARSPLPWALLQVLLLAAFVIVTFARRSGATRPISRESRLSPLEFVSTMGALYQRRGEAAGALEIAFSHFRFLLTRRLRIPSTVATAELIRTAQERPGWTVSGFAGTLQQIESALKGQGVAEQKALAWIGELYDIAAHLGLEPGVGRRVAGS
jgi:hypothetical protein